MKRMNTKGLSEKQTTMPFLSMDLDGRTEAPGYSPLPSVWFGEDSELLDKMLNFYPRKKPKDILDATVNGGRFWRGLDWPVIGMDIDPSHDPTVVGDNTDMPFEDSSFDVVVYDPPHIPNQGKDHSKDFNTRFGLTLKSPKEKGYNFAFMYPPFMSEAYRVLRGEGILLCKIAIGISGHISTLSRLQGELASARVIVS
jgi:SAM-dependent methyltransferase